MGYKLQLVMILLLELVMSYCTYNVAVVVLHWSMHSVYTIYRRLESAVVKDIRNAVVKKCQISGVVVHVYVDKRSAHVSYHYIQYQIPAIIQMYNENTIQDCVVAIKNRN